jgi:lipopolysaccharide/colanic/teichoic acid biosynthesis glycosyltransferase
MNLKVGQPLPAKLVVPFGDIFITLVSLVAVHLVKAPQGETHNLLSSAVALDLFPRGIAASALSIPVLPFVIFTFFFIGTFYIFDHYDLRIFGQPTTLLSRLLLSGALVLAIASTVSLIASGMWRQINILQSVATAVTVTFAWRNFCFANNFLVLKQHASAIAGDSSRSQYMGSEEVGSQGDRRLVRHRSTAFVYAREGAVLCPGVPASARSEDFAERYGMPQLVSKTMLSSGSLPIGLLAHPEFRLTEKSDLSERHLMRKMKRAFDVLLSVTALIFFWPLLTLCAIAIRLDSPGPIIFRQTRVGWHGQTFTIFKLRTMRKDSELKPQWAQVNDARVTRVGRFLRLTHIDELPQLINVLRGEMSFVGPRPERPEFVEKLNRQIPNYDMRHFLLPGITGWAQVNFRYGASVADARRKLELDLYYVMNASLILDLLIVLKTVRVVLFMRGSR